MLYRNDALGGVVPSPHHISMNMNNRELSVIVGRVGLRDLPSLHIYRVYWKNDFDVDEKNGSTLSIGIQKEGLPSA